MIDPLIVESIFDSMADCLIVINHDGEVLFSNRNSDQILGFSPETIREKGLGLTFFLVDENYDFNQILINAIWEKRIHDYKEVDYLHPGGELKRLAATTSYLMDTQQEEDRLIGFVALFRDITEIHMLREREKRLNDEKQRIAKEKIRSLNKLAMGVAHEIRNPVVTIGGFANRIIKTNRNSDEIRQYAMNIMDGVRRLEDVVDQMYDCANLPLIKPIDARMSLVVSKSVEQMRSKAGKRNIEIHFLDNTEFDCLEYFDPILLEIALTHLLDNAIDFSPEGASIAVRLYVHDANVILEVEDHGSGISDSDMEFIFNPFFSTRAVGVGVGLTIVERIVGEHGAKIEVESRPNHGTTFRILFQKHIDPEVFACHLLD